jgi:hypothetical protein
MRTGIIEQKRVWRYLWCIWTKRTAEILVPIANMCLYGDLLRSSMTNEEGMDQSLAACLLAILKENQAMALEKG